MTIPFHKGILPSNVAKFPLQKLKYVQKERACLYQGKRPICWYLKWCQRFYNVIIAQKISIILSLIVEVLEKELNESRKPGNSAKFS